MRLIDDGLFVSGAAILMRSEWVFSVIYLPRLLSKNLLAICPRRGNRSR